MAGTPPRGGRSVATPGGVVFLAIRSSTDLPARKHKNHGAARAPWPRSGRSTFCCVSSERGPVRCRARRTPFAGAPLPSRRACRAAGAARARSTSASAAGATSGRGRGWCGRRAASRIAEREDDHAHEQGAGAPRRPRVCRKCDGQRVRPHPGWRTRRISSGISARRLATVLLFREGSAENGESNATFGGHA
jgi:hypothetical protein